MGSVVSQLNQCIAAVSELWRHYRANPTPEGGHSLRFLVVGKIGVGKTTLITKWLDVNVPPARQQIGATSLVTVEKEGVTLRVYDTRGLNDPDIEDETAIAEILQQTEERVDLILFCISMKGRPSVDEVDIMKNLTKIFPEGKSLWKKTIFILTFANEVELTPRANETWAQQFSEKVREYEQRLRHLLETKVDISPNVARAVPVLPAGFDKNLLPGSPHDDWRDCLWKKAISLTEKMNPKKTTAET